MVFFIKRPEELTKSELVEFTTKVDPGLEDIIDSLMILKTRLSSINSFSKVKDFTRETEKCANKVDSFLGKIPLVLEECTIKEQ